MSGSGWKSLSKSAIRRLAGLAVIVVLVTVVLVLGAVLYGWSQFAKSLPELSGWHEEGPASEFTADQEGPDFSFDDYLALEETIFAELADMEAGAWKDDATGALNRYNPDSISHPSKHGERNWNRSLLREAPNPKGGVVMIHGLSDSPYSFRGLAEGLHREGYSILMLRVPGHGTCPGALAQVEWEDWAAAVRIAARDLRGRLPDEAPLVVAGFSNGGALTVQYTANALLEGDAPVPDALILASPMIAITPMAEITRYHNWIAAASGDDRAHWSAINAPIDPYKFSSWPMNASVQAFQMTKQVEKALAQLDKDGRMDEFPRVFSAVSAIDATVNISDLVTRLYGRLDEPGSELVIFDTNRGSWTENLLKLDYEESLESALRSTSGEYGITVVSNRKTKTPQLREWRRDESGVKERDLDLVWPEELFSLSHSSIPFPEDDPLYGANRDGTLPLPLGALELRGEGGVLRISDGQILRLRHNPFFPYLEGRLLDWLATGSQD